MYVNEWEIERMVMDNNKHMIEWMILSESEQVEGVCELTVGAAEAGPQVRPDEEAGQVRGQVQVALRV